MAIVLFIPNMYLCAEYVTYGKQIISYFFNCVSSFQFKIRLCVFALEFKCILHDSIQTIPITQIRHTQKKYSIRDSYTSYNYCSIYVCINLKWNESKTKPIRIKSTISIAFFFCFCFNVYSTLSVIHFSGGIWFFSFFYLKISTKNIIF